MKRDSPDRTTIIRSKRLPTTTKKLRVDQAGTAAVNHLPNNKVAASETRKWKRIAASGHLDPLWSHIDSVGTRVADMKLSFGTLNNGLDLANQIQPEHVDMVGQQDNLQSAASKILDFSAILLVPDQLTSLHFSSLHSTVYQMSKTLFSDKEMWETLPDAEESRRLRKGQGHRRGRHILVDYIRVDPSKHTGFRIRMETPTAAARNARTGHMAIRLRRKKGSGDELYFLFATPQVDTPITIVVYHSRMKTPMAPVEGLRLNPVTGAREYVAYYDLLWLYTAASFDGRLFGLDQAKRVTETFCCLTGPQELESTRNATLDVFLQRTQKPGVARKGYLPYLTRKRRYNINPAVRNPVTVPDDLFHGPSGVQADDSAFMLDLDSLTVPELMDALLS